LTGDTLKVEHKTQNLGQEVTTDQHVETTMAFMEKENVFDKQHSKWFDIEANVHLEDGSKQVCCPKQICLPTGETRKYMTTRLSLMCFF